MPPRLHFSRKLPAAVPALLAAILAAALAALLALLAILAFPLSGLRTPRSTPPGGAHRFVSTVLDDLRCPPQGHASTHGRSGRLDRRAPWIAVLAASTVGRPIAIALGRAPSVRCANLFALAFSLNRWNLANFFGESIFFFVSVVTLSSGVAAAGVPFGCWRTGEDFRAGGARCSLRDPDGRSRLGDLDGQRDLSSFRFSSRLFRAAISSARVANILSSTPRS